MGALKMGALWIGALLLACGGEDGPVNANTRTDGSTPHGSGSDCSGSWAEVSGGLVDPVTCLAWSDASAQMSWYAAVSSAEAEDGGCSTHCDEDSSSDYCADLSGGFPWTVPTVEQLAELALRDPPFDDLSGDLWSRTSDDTFDELAWTVQLDQAGQEITLGKDSTLAVRCVAPAG